jgi:chromosome segregation ATPase
MNGAEAREYLFHHITALNLTRKKYDELGAEFDKWQKRVELARTKGAADLASEAEAEAGRVKNSMDTLGAEIEELQGTVEKIRRNIPGAAARERSIDPDLLEQELRISLGENPGDEPLPGAQNKKFETLEADSALEALKEKMGLGRSNTGTGSGAHQRSDTVQNSNTTEGENL